jgi:hypothetical protein
MLSKKNKSMDRCGFNKSCGEKVRIRVAIGLWRLPLAIALISFSLPLVSGVNVSLAQTLKTRDPVVLMQNLGSSESVVVTRTLETLRRMGQKAVPILQQALGSSDVIVRRRAAAVLGNIGEDAKEAIPQLINSLRDFDSEVRSLAAEALGDMHAEAKDAIPHLVSAVNDQDSEVRSSAINALETILVYVQEKPGRFQSSLSQSQKQQIITELEAALRKSKDPSSSYSDKEVDFILAYLDYLKLGKPIL